MTPNEETSGRKCVIQCIKIYFYQFEEYTDRALPSNDSKRFTAKASLHIYVSSLWKSEVSQYTVEVSLKTQILFLFFQQIFETCRFSNFPPAVQNKQ